MASSNHAAVARESAGLAAIPNALRQAAIGLGLFVVALMPRAIAQGTFVTVDEAYHWFSRAQKFLTAFQTGDYAATNLIGHPGVTTMWLGSIGLMLQQFFGHLGWASPDSLDTQRIFLRLPVAIVTSICVALAYPLLRRLFGSRAALLATLLWASDPFLIAHSQLLHTDALVTSFMTISLLAAFVAFRVDEGIDSHRGPIRWPLLLGSAVAGGLALLTKSPSILLAPMVGLTAIVSGWGASRWSRRLPIVPLLTWGAVVLVVWFALWPAAWVDLGTAIYNMYGQARYDGAVPHAWGNFFLGRAVDDPGPFFYPVAIAFRLTPWTLVGLIAVISTAIWRRRELPNRVALGLLTVFALVFLLMITTLAKKFDRYALPMFPTLDMIAAIGLLWLGGSAQRWIIERGSASGSRRLAPLAWLGLFAVCGANLVWFHPYEIAYYNQALGGSRVAARTIPVGWGEGYEQVGAFISQQYDGCTRPIATWFGAALLPYVCAPVVPLDWTFKPGEAGYSVLYIDQIQRNDVPEVTSALLGKEQPLHVVRIHGIDYAYIYRIKPPVQHPASARFGSTIQFRGYDLDSSLIRDHGALFLNLHWTADAPVTEAAMLFIHILDGRGERVGQVDVPLIGNGPQASWQPGDYTTWKQQVPIAADLPTGTYWLAIGVYRPDDGSRLSLQAAAPPNAPDDGNDALLLPITLP